MKEEKKRTGNVRSTAEIELQPKTRDLKVSRNSWAEIYKETTALRKHKMLLGQEVQIDDSLEWRVKWAQRGVGALGLLTCIFLVAGPSVAFIVFAKHAQALDFINVPGFTRLRCTVQYIQYTSV